MSEKIAIIGLGYVGLPLMVAMARKFDGVVGFDINPRRIETLKAGEDWTNETTKDELASLKATLTHDPKDLRGCSLFIATVPTPIDSAKRPNLIPVLGACQTIGEILRSTPKTKTPPLIVFESTVYPGLTEGICGPRIAEVSGLKQGVDFKLGYSPERINPGDKVNRLETVCKVISAEDDESLARLDAVYGAIITAGLYRAANIRVAEAAKVLENTQRDINIALMNELAIICDKINIRTHDVLETAGTKWNFLKFTPGLVGGHCIGVDPYYLTSRAEELGYHPQVILAGRRINDGMAIFVAQKIIKLLVNDGSLRQGARVGILGLTFKENVRDIRNSRVPEIVTELQSFGADVLVYDPLVISEQAQHEYGITPCPRESLKDLDALVLAVPHREVMANLGEFWPALKPKGYVIDIKSMLNPATLPKGLRYWSL